ncbi:hypothetical protein QN366_05090 [Pseudomonas sp. CCC3.2]|uniref:hypothetical protein n=1 Tax=unclassified Pseudomonas TaxID=196821 RepID=UPI002AB5C314|nr:MULTISPECIES: hypothetical protein [unclassified Pseudomonas]MDY7559910.1 hypothetical protein [Pseudomonas sp. AB6]MEB0179450.1 hypothetical protein [Pseudomonas sp. CCC3.2]MEB0210516.1 hypothetical protein [Pseudomonas sp. AB6]
MISNVLSMVRQNSIESARLASAVNEFLSRGGQIQQAQAFGYVPKPVTYGSFAPPGKGIERALPIPKAPALPAGKTFWKSKAASDAKALLVEKLRIMSRTMTQTEAAKSVGTSVSTVGRAGIEHGFAFRPAPNNGHKNVTLCRIDPAVDARNVERIKAMRNLGVSRRQAARQMGIGGELMLRLIADYDIDFPVLDKSSSGKSRRPHEQAKNT